MLSVAPEQREDVVWLVGRLDVKGTRAFEAHTRTIAEGNYSAAIHGVPEVRMGLALHARVVAVVEVICAMRGGRFWVRVPPGVAVDDALAAELDAAVQTDRRCFPGR